MEKDTRSIASLGEELLFCFGGIVMGSNRPANKTPYISSNDRPM